MHSDTSVHSLQYTTTETKTFSVSHPQFSRSQGGWLDELAPVLVLSPFSAETGQR